MGEPLPATLEAITPAWLTHALRSCGLLADARVRGARSSIVSEGSGFIGVVARLELDYDGDPAGAPLTCIAKLPSPEPGSRQIGLLYGLYEREVRFYTDLARDVGIATPDCYFANYDADSGQSLILLEELEGGRFGDQVAGCTPEEARLAIEELARLHARWWQSSWLGEVPWMARGPDLLRGALVMAYDACWEPFLARFGHAVSPAIAAAGGALGRRLLAALDQLPDLPVTLVHGDYRLDNMFFAAPGARRRLTVCDWQSPNCGWGTYDLAYFVAGSLPPEERQALEPELCALYHQELSAAGIASYSLEELALDYRRNLGAMLAITVINGATLPTVNERAVLVWERILGRLVQAIADLDALESLPP